MAKLLYQGHGSYRFQSDSGAVIYVDPFAGEGYDLSADIILVTHEHRDHNQISLVPQKAECMILRTSNMLAEGKYGVKTIKEIRIEAVPAYNKNHDRQECVGYLISMDGKKIYAAGDTSMTDYMSESLSKEAVDYAFLPIDGIYNMGAEEAAKCAEVIGAKHTIPIHMMPGELFNGKKAEEFITPSRMIISPGTDLLL
ncbi:MAG: MBL fold metallo-hydrolase [Mobilitalea sp.]